MTRWQRLLAFLHVTPEAARTIRSRVLGALGAGLFAILGAPEVAELLPRLWDQHVTVRVPAVLRVIVPTGAVAFSFVKNWVGTKIGDPRSVLWSRTRTDPTLPPPAGDPEDTTPPVTDDLIEVGQPPAWATDPFAP